MKKLNYEIIKPNLKTTLTVYASEWLEEENWTRNMIYKLDVDLVDLHTCKTNGVIDVTQDCICFLDGELHEFGCEDMSSIKLEVDKDKIYTIQELTELFYSKCKKHYLKYQSINESEISQEGDGNEFIGD